MSGLLNFRRWHRSYDRTPIAISALLSRVCRVTCPRRPRRGAAVHPEDVVVPEAVDERSGAQPNWSRASSTSRTSKASGSKSPPIQSRSASCSVCRGSEIAARNSSYPHGPPTSSGGQARRPETHRGYRCPGFATVPSPHRRRPPPGEGTTSPKTRTPVGRRGRPASSLVKAAEDTGFEPVRGVAPTRFPIVRLRPLGQSSTHDDTAPPRASPGTGAGRSGERAPFVTLASDPARRPSCELPQGRKAARVSGLWRVRGVPFLPRDRPLTVGPAA